MKANKFDMSDAWCDVLLLLFSKPVFHNCNIPDVEDMLKILKCVLASSKLPETLRQRITKIIGTSHIKSPLVDYLASCEARFEWKTFEDKVYFRWKDGEKRKAKIRVGRYLSVRQRKIILDMKKIVGKRVLELATKRDCLE